MAAKDNICFTLKDRLGFEAQLTALCCPAGGTGCAPHAVPGGLTAGFGLPPGKGEAAAFLFCPESGGGSWLLEGLTEPGVCGTPYPR